MLFKEPIQHELKSLDLQTLLYGNLIIYMIFNICFSYELHDIKLGNLN
jgi:hypothetical protein